MTDSEFLTILAVIFFVGLLIWWCLHTFWEWLKKEMQLVISRGIEQSKGIYR